MNFKSILFLFLYIVIGRNSSAQNILISGKIISNNENNEIIYYPPFNNFSNFSFSKKKKVNKDGIFEIAIDLKKTTFIKLIINKSPIWLLVEPKDTINIIIEPSLEKKNSTEWLSISGSNSVGHTYFNCYYNYDPGDKFSTIRTTFERKLNENDSLLLSECYKEINKNSTWLDSLQILGKVTNNYCDFMKTEIEATISRELCNGVEIFVKDNMRKEKLIFDLFKKYNPLDVKLFTSLYGKHYIEYYYEYNFKNEVKTDKEIIIEELPYLSSAPVLFQEYIWANNIALYKMGVPDMYDYCQLFEKYKRNFQNEEYIDALKKINLCNLNEKSNIKYVALEVDDTDFFTTVVQNFSYTRLYIDLWATWCGPCRIEFLNYDSTFNKYLEEREITPLFISIDGKEKRGIWDKSLPNLNLSGIHILAGTSLLKSIEEDIYENKQIDIPRYILLEKGGKVLSLDAPRPSDPKIRQIFDELLKDRK